jgi:hypothetical protein
MKKIYLLSSLAFSLVLSAHAQRTCGTYSNLEKSFEKDPALRTQFETMEKNITDEARRNARTSQSIVFIPVVVHVIHNNEAVGSGTNISDAQVLDQIVALNEDFRLLNADSLQPTHPFWPYTCDAQIEFCLARQTPGGQPTNGIERIFGGLDWTMDDCNNILKPQTIWDRDRYLNLWTVDWGGTNSSLLGFAQFPGQAANTDGVVIGYNYFGTVGNVTAPYDYGRTATHEIGHWLDLHHIWGDAFCGDDLISDTPPQEDANSNCPGFPHNAFNSCGSGNNGEMYMNYMDYVDDRCMVMFTYEQAVRMNTALYNVRTSLLTSNGCSTPNPGIDENKLFAENLSIYPNPTSGICKVRYVAPGSGEVSIKVLDISGREVKVVQSQFTDAILEVDLSDLKNGAYFFELSQNGLTATKKVSLIR